MPPANLWQRCLRHTSQALAIIRLLSPTLLQLVAALVPLAAYTVSDQGADVLSALGEGLSSSSNSDDHWRAGWFVVINIAAGVVIWWSARMTLEFKLVPLSIPWGIWKGVRRHVRLWWPRLLGAGAVLNIGLAFLIDARDYGIKAPPPPVPPPTHAQAAVPGATPAPDMALAPAKSSTPPIITAGVQKYRAGLITLGYTHCVIALVLLFIFISRRVWLRKTNAPDPGPRYRNVSDVLAQSPADFYFTAALVVFSLAVLISLWVSPIPWGQHVGTGAILSLAAISGVTWGTLVLNSQARTGLPVIVFLVGWAAWCSSRMDNHDIRLSHDFDGHPGLVHLADDNDHRQTVQQAVNHWYPEKSTAAGTDAPPGIEPVFVVATEGGGIRAAYWTALVLGHLQEETAPAPAPNGTNPTPHDFASRLFAISGISGGSVGSAVFTALLVDGKPGLAAHSSEILGDDHLSPLIGTLLFPDLLQRFCPKVLPGTDRAASIEESWERSYRRVAGSNRLADPFRNLWNDKNKRVPHLFLNSTMVDSGQRLIFSDLAISAGPPGGEFMAAQDARDFVYTIEDGRKVLVDVPLSTAAHASARFTYTNPAGRLTARNHFVDGGYFEDSGATTALEVVEAIERVQAARDADWKARADEADNNHIHRPVRGRRLVPVVINISNDPAVLAEGGRLGEDNSAPGGQEGIVPEGRKPPAPDEEKPFHFASELLSPPLALMQTRGARGAFARRAICEHQRRQWDLLAADKEQAWPKEFTELFHLADPVATQRVIPTYIEFGLVKQGIPLPLGWSLSQGAKDDMESQFYISRQAGTQSNPGSEAAVQQWMRLAP